MECNDVLAEIGFKREQVWKKQLVKICKHVVSVHILFALAVPKKRGSSSQHPFSSVLVTRTSELLHDTYSFYKHITYTHLPSHSTHSFWKISIPQKCRVTSTSSKVATSSPQCSRYHLLHGHWTCDKDIATGSHNLHLHCFHSILQIHGPHLGKRARPPSPKESNKGSLHGISIAHDLTSHL